MICWSASIIPPIATTLWFTVLGRTEIWVEQNNPGAISEPLTEGGLPVAVMAIASNLPLGGALAAGFLLLTITFVATAGDSMAYAVARACVRDDSPPSWLRAMWALIMGGAAAVLISI